MCVQERAKLNRMRLKKKAAAADASPRPPRHTTGTKSRLKSTVAVVPTPPSKTEPPTTKPDKPDTKTDKTMTTAPSGTSCSEAAAAGSTLSSPSQGLLGNRPEEGTRSSCKHAATEDQPCIEASSSVERATTTKPQEAPPEGAKSAFSPFSGRDTHCLSSLNPTLSLPPPPPLTLHFYGSSLLSSPLDPVPAGGWVGFPLSVSALSPPFLPLPNSPLLSSLPLATTSHTPPTSADSPLLTPSLFPLSLSAAENTSKTPPIIQQATPTSCKTPPIIQQATPSSRSVGVVKKKRSRSDSVAYGNRKRVPDSRSRSFSTGISDTPLPQRSGLTTPTTPSFPRPSLLPLSRSSSAGFITRKISPELLSYLVPTSFSTVNSISTTHTPSHSPTLPSSHPHISTLKHSLTHTTSRTTHPPMTSSLSPAATTNATLLRAKLGSKTIPHYAVAMDTSTQVSAAKKFAGTHQISYGHPSNFSRASSFNSSSSSCSITTSKPTTNFPSSRTPSFSGPSISSQSIPGPSISGQSISGPSILGPSVSGPSNLSPPTERYRRPTSLPTILSRGPKRRCASIGTTRQISPNESSLSSSVVARRRPLLSCPDSFRSLQVGGVEVGVAGAESVIPVGLDSVIPQLPTDLKRPRQLTTPTATPNSAQAYTPGRIASTPCAISGIHTSRPSGIYGIHTTQPSGISGIHTIAPSVISGIHPTPSGISGIHTSRPSAINSAIKLPAKVKKPAAANRRPKNLTNKTTKNRKNRFSGVGDRVPPSLPHPLTMLPISPLTLHAPVPRHTTPTPMTPLGLPNSIPGFSGPLLPKSPCTTNPRTGQPGFSPGLPSPNGSVQSSLESLSYHELERLYYQNLALLEQQRQFTVILETQLRKMEQSGRQGQQPGNGEVARQRLPNYQQFLGCLTEPDIETSDLLSPSLIGGCGLEKLKDDVVGFVETSRGMCLHPEHDLYGNLLRQCGSAHHNNKPLPPIT